MVCTVDLGPIDRNVYNVGDLIDDDYISISTYILNALCVHILRKNIVFNKMIQYGPPT